MSIKNTFPAVQKLSLLLWRFAGADFAWLTQMLNVVEIGPF